ncbi:MAG: metalloregulator ArsR/SmtB family transcription factor [Lachnospiraceae bacterium]|nr:metalloregulator ArsR/SmtB family transcription factor [Lachnospiraceae bacterium]
MGKDKKKRAKKAEKASEKKGKSKSGKSKSVPKSFPGESVENGFSAAPIQHTHPKKASSRHTSDASAQEMLAIFQALSDENRLKIMTLLANGELSTPELLESIDVVQSTMSHHMKALSEAGLVQSRRVGKRSCYRVRKDTLERMASYFQLLCGE